MVKYFFTYVYISRIINNIYEYDNVIAKTEYLITTGDFSVTMKDSVRNFFLKVVKEMKLNYKKNNFKIIYSELLEDFSYAYDILLFAFLKGKVGMKTTKAAKNGVIDITDDAIDV